MVGHFFVYADIYIYNNDINTYLDMKQIIRLTESDLHRIVNESVNKILNEEMQEGKIGNFFNNFRRTVPVSNVGSKIPTNGNGTRYFYNSKTGTYYYVDENGERHDTGIGYGEGRVPET